MNTQPDLTETIRAELLSVLGLPTSTEEYDLQLACDSLSDEQIKSMSDETRKYFAAWDY